MITYRVSVVIGRMSYKFMLAFVRKYKTLDVEFNQQNYQQSTQSWTFFASLGHRKIDLF